MQDWIRFWRVVDRQAGIDQKWIDENVRLVWPTTFPLRTVVANRVVLLDGRDEIVHTICE
jgi:hypothetical protein